MIRRSFACTASTKAMRLRLRRGSIAVMRIADARRYSGMRTLRRAKCSIGICRERRCGHSTGAVCCRSTVSIAGAQLALIATQFATERAMNVREVRFARSDLAHNRGCGASFCDRRWSQCDKFSRSKFRNDCSAGGDARRGARRARRRSHH